MSELEGLTRVRYRTEGHLAHVTLDRPDKHNAMDLLMHHELGLVWDEVERDEDVWLVVLTGAGERAFSTGQDLAELNQRVREGVAGTSSFGSAGRPGYPRLTERFERSTPVIARVDGYAYGGGFELAMACDLVIASDRSSFALPEARLGLIAGAGGVFRLARQAPYRIALGHLITGRPMSATRAYELGLVNEVVPADQLDDCVRSWVKDVLSCAPLAVRAAKQAAEASLSMTLPEAFAAQYPWESRRRQSADAVEGPMAFMEKRPPEWTGR